METIILNIPLICLEVMGLLFLVYLAYYQQINFLIFDFKWKKFIKTVYKFIKKWFKYISPVEIIVIKGKIISVHPHENIDQFCNDQLLFEDYFVEIENCEGAISRPDIKIPKRSYKMIGEHMDSFVNRNISLYFKETLFGKRKLDHLEIS